MTEPVTSQLILFIYTIMTGILAGLIYDFYAGVGYVMRFKKKVLTVGDIILWLVLIVVVYSMLLYYNQGEVRFFVLLGLGIGAGLYYRFCRRPARAVIWWLLEQVSRLLRLTWRLLIWLLALIFFPFRVFYLAVNFPFRLVGQLWGQAAAWIVGPLKKAVPAPLKEFNRRLSDRWKRIKTALKRQ